MAVHGLAAGSRCTRIISPRLSISAVDLCLRDITMLEFRGVSRTFEGITAVHPFDLAVEEGEVLVLLGPSGCGKTTILRMVAGLLSPTSGQIILDSTLI